MPVEYYKPEIEIPLGVVKNWKPKIMWRPVIGQEGGQLGPVDSTNIHNVILTLPMEDEKKWLSKHPFAISSTSYDTSDPGVKIDFEDLELDDNKFGFWNAQYTGKYILKLNGQGDFPNKGVTPFDNLPLTINILRRGEKFDSASCPDPEYHWNKNLMGICAEYFSLDQKKCIDSEKACVIKFSTAAGKFTAKYGFLQIIAQLIASNKYDEHSYVEIRHNQNMLDQLPISGEAIKVYETVGKDVGMSLPDEDAPVLTPRCYVPSEPVDASCEAVVDMEQDGVLATRKAQYSLLFNTYLMMKVEDPEYPESYWVPLLRVDWGMDSIVKCGAVDDDGVASPCASGGIPQGEDFNLPPWEAQMMETSPPEKEEDAWEPPSWQLQSNIDFHSLFSAQGEPTFDPSGWCACLDYQ